MNDFNLYTPDFITQEFLLPLLNSPEWTISKTITRRDCLIYKATNPDFKTPITIKIYNRKRTKAGTPKALYKALNKHYETDQIDFNVPQPIAYHSDHGTVIMEWVETPPLRNMIWQLLIARKSTVTRAGAWLNWFHNRNDIKTAPYHDTALPKINALMADENFTPPKDFMACYETFKTHAKTNHGKAVLHGIIHGDFTPYNILIGTQNRMIGIDFTAQNTAPLYADIARFYMYLNSYRPIYMSAKADYKALTNGYSLAPNDSVHRTILMGEIMRRWSVLTLARAQHKFHLWREIELIRISFMAKALQKSLR